MLIYSYDGKLINIKRSDYHNNIDYYAKIIKIKFNKELERDSMNPDDIINLILNGK